jgi:nucleoside-triphosphate--adenylate kinase
MIATRHFCSNVSRSFRALITGAPGSGKGTISSRIARDFGLVHLSSGDVLRLHVKQGSQLGVEAKDYIDQGALVPDDLMVELMTSEIERLSNKRWLLDGR